MKKQFPIVSGDQDYNGTYEVELSADEKRILAFEDAARTLLNARAIKKAAGDSDHYRELKNEGWRLLEELMKGVAV